MTARFPLSAEVWLRESTQEWVLEISGAINETSLTSRHTQPAHLAPEDVPDLPTHYETVPHQKTLSQAEAAISSLMDQIGQMKGMFDDEDGAIAASLKDGETALKMIEAVNTYQIKDD